MFEYIFIPMPSPKKRKAVAVVSKSQRKKSSTLKRVKEEGIEEEEDTTGDEQETEQTEEKEEKQEEEPEKEQDKEAEKELVIEDEDIDEFYDDSNLTKIPVLMLAIIIGASFGISAFFIFISTSPADNFEIAQIETNYNIIYVNETPFNTSLVITVYDQDNNTIPGVEVTLRGYGSETLQKIFQLKQTYNDGHQTFDFIIDKDDIPKTGLGEIRIHAEKEGYGSKDFVIEVRRASTT